MSSYHKIPTLWKRDPATNYKTLIQGAWATPELEALSDLQWIAEEKVDGTNVRVVFNGFCDGVEFRGRSDNAQMPPHLLRQLESMFDLDALGNVFECEKHRERGEAPDIVLYGEGYGAKIQKGGGDYIPDGCSFILFDVRVGSLWLQRDAVSAIAGSLGILKAPEFRRMTLRQAADLAQVGFESELRLTPPEGLVLRPPVELFDRRGDRIITKIKLKDFQS